MDISEKYEEVLDILKSDITVDDVGMYSNGIKKMLMDGYDVTDVVDAVIEYKESSDGELLEYLYVDDYIPLEDIDELTEDCTQASSVNGGRIDCFTDKDKDKKHELK